MTWSHLSLRHRASLVLLTTLGSCGGFISSFAGTNVSVLPDLGSYPGMKRIVGLGPTDALVTNFDDNGTVLHLVHDGWQWQVAAAHPVTDWLGYPRMDANSVFPMGDEVLILDTSRLVNGLNIPEITVLEKQDGALVITQKVSLESELDDPQYFSISIHDIVPLQDLLLLNTQVGVMGVGGVLKTYCFVRTESGWTLGPSMDRANGYWWPLYADRVDGVLHLWSLQMEGYYDGTPKTFTVQRHALVDGAWQPLGTEGQFTYNTPWVGMNHVRTLISPDRSSMLLFGTDNTPVHPLELRKSGPVWISAGEVSFSSPVSNRIYLAKLGDGVALLRAGDAIAHFYDNPLQHYHLLRHVEGHWLLQGDLPSHRQLYDYPEYGISYALSGDRLTIFDFSPWNEAARAYDLASLQPVAIKWFRDSTSAGAGWEGLEALGFFHPQFTTDRSGIWLWHANLGWIYATGRSSSQFWFWHPALGWTYFNSQHFNLSQGISWLYADPLHDFLWFLPAGSAPRFFYSTHYQEWVTDREPPGFDSADLAALASQASFELEEEGVTVVVDLEANRLILTAEETVDGKLVGIRIEAPWQYQTSVDYPSHARFTLDLSSILVTVDGQTTAIDSFQLWTEAKVLMPSVLTIDFFFHTEDSGIAIEVIGYNNGSRDPPVREPFAP